jgi:putative methyltransferase (TIGR04325 family)
MTRMREHLRPLISGLMPPAALHTLMRIAGPVRFTGRYRTWDEAQQASGGYDSDLILTKVRDALLKVKTGEAVYERDSVLFDKIEYSWPLLAGLLWISSLNDNKLNLIDFGGSLGSSYYQNRGFLAHLRPLTWNIVEQPKFVECGKQNFEDDTLKFYGSIPECLAATRPDTVLFLSVLQYLERPYDMLRSIIDRQFRFIIIDRTPFLVRGADRITVQRVSSAIYRASYPAWLFNEEAFLDLLLPSYECVTDFVSFDSGDGRFRYKGFLFRRREPDAGNIQR